MQGKTFDGGSQLLNRSCRGEVMISSDQFLVGSHNRGLVALSVAIAIVAAYAVLGLTGRTTSAGGKVRFFRLSGGGLITGGRIWPMHYVALLAFPFLIYAPQEWPTDCCRCLLPFLSPRSGCLS
jgi:hypothetical protein